LRQPTHFQDTGFILSCIEYIELKLTLHVWSSEQVNTRHCMPPRPHTIPVTGKVWSAHTCLVREGGAARDARREDCPLRDGSEVLPDTRLDTQVAR